MIRPILFLRSLILILPVLGCGENSPSKSGYAERVNPKNPSDRIAGIPDNDEKMNNAMAKARATVDTFLTALKEPTSNRTRFAVKLHFNDGSRTEHIWISKVTFDGVLFHGVIPNDPQIVKSVKAGQKVSVAKGEISDWMFVENNKLVGGETLRAVRNAFNDKDRIEFDKSLPFVID